MYKEWPLGWISYACAGAEMSHVLHHYMQFVPTAEADGFLVLPNGSKVPFDDTRFDTKLLGGDQLTVV